MSMLVSDARAAARSWVTAHAAGERGFLGAFLSGSAVARPPTSELPATSDVDVVVVHRVARPKLGQFVHSGALLDVSFLTWAEVAASARSWVFAAGFACDNVLADPTGALHELHRAIAPTYAATAGERVDGVVASIRDRLRPPDPRAAWHDQVTAWLFPASLTTHVPLMAALRPPTVRLRYLAAREVTSPAGYDALLDVLGCRDVDPDPVRHHLDVLTSTFDRAGPSPARAAAIDGQRDLVDRGDHREAVFWLVATFARCRARLDDDAGFRAAVADLTGLREARDIDARRTAVLDLIACGRSWWS